MENRRMPRLREGLKMVALFMNRETGEVLTYTKARKQWREEYDGGDPLNAIPFSEYYAFLEYYDGEQIA